MESAVLLCVPEAEALVGPWRSEHDPSAAKGVPAHVTLLYPFLPADEVDAGVLGELEWFFAGVDAFALEFDSIGEFPGEGVMFLAAATRVLADLTGALARRWPECPPYEGKHERPVPHLTAVRSPVADVRARACRELQASLPLAATASSAELWVCDDAGSWTSRATFAFGQPE